MRVTAQLVIEQSSDVSFDYKRYDETFAKHLFLPDFCVRLKF
jgi:hypothetical protein